jgi:methylmalonyl-CoA mutase cobalamin-binding subunit
MVYGLLRQRGYRVRYLGADVATFFLVDAVQVNQPSAVLLSSSIAGSFPGCLAAIAALRKHWPGNGLPLVLVGGEMAGQREQVLTAAGAIALRDADLMVELERHLPVR